MSYTVSGIQAKTKANDALAAARKRGCRLLGTVYFSGQLRTKSDKPKAGKRDRETRGKRGGVAFLPAVYYNK